MNTYLSVWGRLFALLGVVFIPFPMALLPQYQVAMHALLLKPLSGLARYWPATLGPSADVSSDSVLLYLLLALLLLLAAVLAAAWLWLKGQLVPNISPAPLVHKVLVYYLALQLARYGFDKLFKGQFYLPEPNILYTPLGMLDQDVLYWSVMGLSYPYNVFMGGMEVLAAIGLLIRPTRVLSLLLSGGIFVHVVAVNWSFDISVKLYASFLLGLSILLLAPQMTRLYAFLVQQKHTALKPELALQYASQYPFGWAAGKTFVLCLICMEVLYPYLRSGYFNDDNSPRPYLHGAYTVEAIRGPQGSSIPPDLHLKRLFIHRDGYLIFQHENDKMEDFKLTLDTLHQQLILTNYQLSESRHAYHLSPVAGQPLQELIIDYTLRDTTYQIHSRPLAWRQLPALQRKFHWTVDAVGR